MYEPSVVSIVVFVIGLLITIIGIILIFVALGEANASLSLFSFLSVILGLMLITHPVLGTWYLFLKNAAVAVPTWAWVVISMWLYGNLGWRFAECKLRVAKQWRTTHPVWLHILWPWLISNNETDDFADSSLNWRTDYYEFLSTVFFAPILVGNALLVIVLWLLWFGTMGRFKPIHPKIWAEYHKAKTS